MKKLQRIGKPIKLRNGIILDPNFEETFKFNEFMRKVQRDFKVKSFRSEQSAQNCILI